MKNKESFDQDIIHSKKILRSKSKDYKKNFQTIENFIKQEVEEIEKLQKNNYTLLAKTVSNYIFKKNEKQRNF